MTTGAVARLLGVSPVTLRSWDRRYGIGPAERRTGGHRRWRPADIAVLREMCRLTAAGLAPAESARAARARFGPSTRLPPEADGARFGSATPPPPETDGARFGLSTPPPPGTDGARFRSTAPPPPEADGVPPAAGPVRAAAIPAQAGAGHTAARAGGRQGGPGGGLALGEVRRECRGLARAAVRLDAPAVDELLGTLVARHGPVVAWEEVMVPVLHAVGRTWETSGDRYVEVEHLLSWHVSTALRRTAASAAPSAAGDVAPVPVLLACVPDEQHCLALEALAAGLGALGVPYRMFGAAVPVEALGAAVRRTGPAAVVLWSQSRSTANAPLARDIAATGWGVRGARTAPVVLTAGPGWAGPRPAGTIRPLSLREALTVLAGVCGVSPGPGPV
ncbi:MerR family transcriptional regulator [Streptomyces sp. NRRL S-118]|uniref:MerR family transcriptional regulator n=1 Tax=Streptomyces sp. NRRL S-118 TaxID=1463881 RepID=UPI0006937D7A|nr:MerR family transcriptional regulator [Streptomyces sp. NRRL S-118]